MNLHALRVFTYVAQFESITEAAKQLHISQPAVTAQVRNLERDVGKALISSKGRGIELTATGAFLAEQGQRLFQLEQQIDANLQLFLQRKARIQIAASYISTNYVLPPVLAKYKLAHPEVDIYVSLGNVKSVEQRVLNYEVDYGFVIQSNIGHKDLYFEKIIDVPFWFVVHPTHPLANRHISLDELQQHDFIYREKGSSTRDLLEAFFYRHNCPLPKFGLEIQGAFESVKIVEAGYGVAIAPACGVLEAITQQKLARVFVEQAAIHQSLFVCTRKADKAAQPFIHYLKENIAHMQY